MPIGLARELIIEAVLWEKVVIVAAEEMTRRKDI